MTINFVEDSTNGYIEYYAISELEVYKGKAHDELLWAEIRQVGLKTFRVIWEDAWQEPHFFSSLQEAKDHIIKMYSKHHPHINGTTFNIDEL